ncbi:response regulator [Undibacterium sp. Xuan67W]|uniref:response regulator n=1 Tax=Undibacterium sp. Xuan67W TaxID=3413057 RepID=UPI003BF0F935
MRQNYISLPDKKTFLLLVGLGYFLLASLSIRYLKNGDPVSAFWFPNALAVASLLYKRELKFFVVLSVLGASNFFANFLFGSSSILAVLFVVPNLIEISIAYWLCKKTNYADNFESSPARLLGFVAIICCIPPVFSAVIGGGLFSYFHISEFTRVAPLWFARSCIGMVSLLPVLLLYFSPHDSNGRKIFPSILFFAFGLLSMSVTTIALAYLPYPHIYTAIPIIGAALVLSFRETALLVFVHTCVVCLLMNLGYFIPIPIMSNWQSLLIYIPILLAEIPAVVVAAAMNEVNTREKQRRGFEEELIIKNRDLNTVINSFPSMIGYWNTDLKNIFANNAYLDFFGFVPDQIKTRHIREVIGEERYQLNKPHIDAALRGEEQMFERTFITPSGEVKDSIASYIPTVRDGVVNGFYAFVTDVTPIKRAQRAQFEAQYQLQVIFDSATEFSIIATSTDGVITLFSRGAEKMLGYSSEEVVGQTSPAIFHLANEVVARGAELSRELGRTVEGFEAFVALAKMGIAEQREWTYIRKDKSTLPVKLVVTAIRDSKDQVSGFLGIASDISQQKELDLLMLNAKEAAEKANRAKSNFVANMSHEIRTPMNAVLGITQLLSNTRLEAGQRKYLEMIRVSGQALMQILNDILDFSKIEADKLELSSTEFILDDVLGALASLMSVNAGDKDLELAIGVDPSVPQKLVGDQLRLQQILINLVGNSIKFTAKGEVSVFVDTVLVDFGASPDSVHLRFSIKDTGIGMDDRQISQLFIPFSQADASITRKFGGTGLGLTIVQRIVQLMGGKIKVRSQLGKGSEFQLIIPMKLGGVVGAVQIQPDAAKLNLLVVDDNHTSRDYICRTIRGWNWHAESASSGMQAIEYVRSNMRKSEARIDAILVDWQMPMMDGLVTIKTLRELMPDDQIPLIIMVNAYSRDRLIQEQAALYADAILMKPLTGSSLFDTLHEAIATRSGENISSPFLNLKIANYHRLDNIRILVVEDNSLNQIVARGLLEQGGASVEVVDNGHLAVERLRGRLDDFDIILMDVQMPVMDGITATRIIRNDLNCKLPILALTAGVMLSERNRCAQAGMNGFITKPIDVDGMFSTIANYLPMLVKDLEKAELSQPGDISPPHIELATFNPATLLALVKNNPQDIQKIVPLIRDIASKIPSQIILLEQALQDGQLTDIATLVHTMRGSIGTLGAKKFVNISLEIESAVKVKDTDAIAALLQDASIELRKIIDQSGEWLSAQNYAEVERSYVDITGGETLEKMKHLKALLSQNNLAACDLYFELREFISKKLSPQGFEEINTAMDNLQFDHVIKKLNESNF